MRGLLQHCPSGIFSENLFMKYFLGVGRELGKNKHTLRHIMQTVSCVLTLSCAIIRKRFWGQWPRVHRKWRTALDRLASP